jgi:hypothetical protein
MNTRVRRYIFLDFETLKSIHFKKLEKVCDKVFVFVSSEISAVPLRLVKEMQKMGNDIKWIEISATSAHDSNYHMCFLMGKLHDKIGADIEFAIISDDISFDPLISFINSSGRSCLRVRQQSENDAETNTQETNAEAAQSSTEPALSFRDKPETKRQTSASSVFSAQSFSQDEAVAAAPNVQNLQETARQTIERLVKSGNRPANLMLLRNYIILNNQHLGQNGSIEKVIQYLVHSQEIKIENESVHYNF